MTFDNLTANNRVWTVWSLNTWYLTTNEFCWNITLELRIDKKETRTASFQSPHRRYRSVSNAYAPSTWIARIASTIFHAKRTPSLRTDLIANRWIACYLTYKRPILSRISANHLPAELLSSLSQLSLILTTDLSENRKVGCCVQPTSLPVLLYATLTTSNTYSPCRFLPKNIWVVPISGYAFGPGIRSIICM